MTEENEVRNVHVVLSKRLKKKRVNCTLHDLFQDIWRRRRDKKARSLESSKKLPVKSINHNRINVIRPYTDPRSENLMTWCAIQKRRLLPRGRFHSKVSYREKRGRTI